MKVRCISDNGESLRPFENEPIGKDVFGRFGASAYTRYGVEIGREYLVMGIIIYQTYQAYLIDDDGLIFSYPCQLFEILDGKLISSWHFRIVGEDEDIYPFVQAILGYLELCSDKKSYINLIIEKDVYARQIYFKRKIEIENEEM